MALGAALLLWLVSYGIKQYTSPKRAWASVESAFQKSEAQARAWLGKDSLWLDVSSSGFKTNAARQLDRAPVPVFILKNNNLTFWGGPANAISREQLLDTSANIISTPFRQYYPLYRSLGEGRVAALAVPLDNLQHSTDKSGHPIYNSQGQLAFYAQPVLLYDSGFEHVGLAFELLAMLSFMVCLVLFFRRLVTLRKIPLILWGLMLMLAASLMMYWVSSLSYPTISIFWQLQESPLPLALLIGGAPLSVWMLSLLQQFPYDFRSTPIGRWHVLAVTGYLSIGFGILGAGYLMKMLILQSEVAFDFNNILRLQPLAVLCILAILFYLLVLLLYSLWVGRNLQRSPLSRIQRFGSIALSIAIIGFFAPAFDLGLPVLTLVLMLVLYIALLDLFAEIQAASPAWLLLWLALLAAYSTGLMFKYHLEVRKEQRVAFATRLAKAEDPRVEKVMDEVLGKLLVGGMSIEQVESRLDQIPYLNRNYQYELNIEAGRTAEGRWYKVPPNDQYQAYALQYPWQGDSSLMLRLQPSIRSGKRIFHQLTPLSFVTATSYGFALRWQDKIIEQRGYLEREWFQDKYWPVQKPGVHEVVTSREALTYVALDDQHYQVMVTELMGGYLKPASLFSYLFALLTIIALFLFVANHYFNLLPATPGQLLFGQPSIRHRFQIATITLTLAAFLIAALVTVTYMQRNALENQGDQLLDQVEAILRDIRGRDKVLENARYLSELANIHQIDITAYSPEGRLQASSLPYLYEQNIKAARINPNALYAYQSQGFKPTVLREQTGPLAHITVYAPMEGQPAELRQFLAFAFDPGEDELKAQTTALMSNLLNLYVFLLLMASALAIAVSNSITKPLLEIGEKIRRFRLGKNEPIEWESQDEIGQLVAAYNQMMEQLEESTEKLRQSEREGAWREMAKQVAHEIKNPLTPMKLSIQYLQHAQRTDPERARQMISRVSNTLIEQIDGLAHIATAFSNFAKMPQAQLEEVELKAVVTSVFRLFTEGQSPEATLQIDFPDNPVIVQADPRQLSRIFNNLIKNAQQAIPEDREGRIEVNMYVQQNTATVEVKDNGTGIPEEIQPRVFQPNFTTKSSGMGLGLAMCKNMMESMNGRIYFETVEGEGTTFFVTLPLL